MNPIAANQGRTFLQLFADLRPHLHLDRNLPVRLQQRLARERRFGSRDRRLYRELLYTAIRHLPWFESALARSEDDGLRVVAWLAADSPATRPLKDALVPDWPPVPPTVAAKAAQLGATQPLLPAWFRTHCPAAFDSPELDTLHTRAPLWLRIQTDTPDPIFAEFTARNWSWRKNELLPDAIELMTEADVTATDSWERGLIEVQDLGSQLILAAVAPTPGSRWLDACAGAGGKALQLARLLGPNGKVDAADPRAAALAELRHRAQRAGIATISTFSAPPPAGPTGSLYDGVLVDAPCTGSGTWRRSPHLKWCTRDADITAAAAVQTKILAAHAPLVRPGGLLVYATCSLSHRENTGVITDFLAAHATFTPAPLARTFGYAPAGATQLTILPTAHNTDAYFIATLRRQ